MARVWLRPTVVAHHAPGGADDRGKSQDSDDHA
jgi:hypothetical protein